MNDQIHQKEQKRWPARPTNNVIETVVQLLCENGMPQMADAMRLLLNEAMRIERSQLLETGPYQRTDQRHGYANGYKPKTVQTRLGELALQVPQVRGEVEFYPSALERSVRSEQALKCAIAEMYVQGVPTRKVAAVMSELCGLEVSSTQVRRASRLLDEELDRWRKRPLGKVPYVFLDARSKPPISMPSAREAERVARDQCRRKLHCFQLSGNTPPPASHLELNGENQQRTRLRCASVFRQLRR